ncbi:DNA cytosine methyltransferase, partial [[Eubacterium] siraeum]|nr:DNA cytosine methyltransferase [[Eubacterium] siraeum]
RILQEMRDGGKALPRYLLMENVPTLLAERHKDNYKKWIEDLKGLGYISYYFQLNASNFGLPQNRPRLLMISVFIKDYDEKTIEKINSFFDKKSSKDIVDEYASSRYYHKID